MDITVFRIEDAFQVVDDYPERTEIALVIKEDDWGKAINLDRKECFLEIRLSDADVDDLIRYLTLAKNKNKAFDIRMQREQT